MCMNEDMNKSLFNPFKQQNASSAREHGCGQGFSIVRNLTEMLGGTIYVASKTLSELAYQQKKIYGPLCYRLRDTERCWKLMGTIMFTAKALLGLKKSGMELSVLSGFNMPLMKLKYHRGVASFM